MTEQMREAIKRVAKELRAMPDEEYSKLIAGDSAYEHYCLLCQSCGEDGCCGAQFCLYPGIKQETVETAKEIAESVCTENIRLRRDLKWFETKVMTLFANIKHGDEAHQKWLKDELDRHFARVAEGRED